MSKVSPSQPKKLKILKHRAISPVWKTWFRAFTESWGKQNNTQVLIDEVGFGALKQEVVAEAKAQQGHDLVRVSPSPPLYQSLTIDHREIFEECIHRYGKPYEITLKETYDPKSNKFYCFPTTYIP